MIIVIIVYRMDLYAICFLATLSIIFVFGGLYYYYLSTGNFVQIHDEHDSDSDSDSDLESGDQEPVMANTV